MKRFASLLLVAASSIVSAQGSADVKAFVDRIKAVNPTDRWMESGTITCNKQVSQVRDGKTNSYATYSTLSFSNGYAVLDVQRDGLPLGDLLEDATDLQKEMMARGKMVADTVTYIAPGQTIIYSPASANAWMSKWPVTNLDRYIDPSSGVLSSILLDRALADPLRSSVVGSALTAQFNNSISATITVDDKGRVSLASYRLKDMDWRASYSDHQKVGNIWLPTRVSVYRYTDANNTSTTDCSFTFDAKPPEASSLLCQLPPGTHLQGDWSSWFGGQRNYPRRIGADNTLRIQATHSFCSSYPVTPYCTYLTNSSCCSTTCWGTMHYWVHYHRCSYGGEDCQCTCTNYDGIIHTWAYCETIPITTICEGLGFGSYPCQPLSFDYYLEDGMCDPTCCTDACEDCAPYCMQEDYCQFLWYCYQVIGEGCQ
jgi:hypothetical protein